MQPKNIKLSISFDDLLNITKQLSKAEKNLLIEELKKEEEKKENKIMSLPNLDKNMVNLYKKMARKGQINGLTEDNIAELFEQKTY